MEPSGCSFECEWHVDSALKDPFAYFFLLRKINSSKDDKPIDSAIIQHSVNSLSFEYGKEFF